MNTAMIKSENMNAKGDTRVYFFIIFHIFSSVFMSFHAENN